MIVTSTVGTRWAEGPIGIGAVMYFQVEQGGRVLQMSSSFDSDGLWGLGGLWISEGSGAIMNAPSDSLDTWSLGAFDATHPIMEGVSGLTGRRAFFTDIATDATWVADWDTGEPLVATRGHRSGPGVETISGCVVGINASPHEGHWGGDLPTLVRNSLVWLMDCPGGGGGRTHIPWLSVDPGVATVAPDGSLDLMLTFDSEGLDVGTYNAQIVIKSNDPANPEVTVTALLDVELASVSGTILLQGRPEGDHDGTTVLFVGPETVTTETDENGNFSVVLTTGTYTVTATHRNYLPAENVVDLELPSGDSVGLAEPVVSGMLLVGDLNGDEIIDHYDLMLAASNQGETESQLQLQP